MAQYKRYCFIGEYFDSMASLVRQYQIFIYPDDESIEMYDIKTRKIMLKRIINPEIKLKSLYIGADVNIYSRKMKIVEYGDDFTRKTFEELRSSTFALILPPAYMAIGKIIDLIYQNGFQITKMKMNKLNDNEAKEYLTVHNSSTNSTDITVKDISSDLVVGMELVKKNAVPDFQKVVNEHILPQIKIDKSILYSIDNESALLELGYFFTRQHSPQLTNCSCLVLKPHVIMDGHAGKIIDIVLNEGFEISSMEMFYLDKATAEGFFDVYRGVLPEYAPIVTHVISGPVIAIEVRQDDVVGKVRALVGPHDPELAKTLRPNTLRAMFGVDRVKNVCHCTDLPEDGVLECQYFFELL